MERWRYNESVPLSLAGPFSDLSDGIVSRDGKGRKEFGGVEVWIGWEGRD